MDFFDCNILYGMAATKCNLMPANDLQTVLAQMKQAGITKALVRREEQFVGAAAMGNQLVADDVKNTNNLWGVWSIIPHYTHEIPDPDSMPSQMKANRIVAWQLVPMMHYHPLKPWLELACKAAIPIIVKPGPCITDIQLYDMLEMFPDLVIIFSAESV